MITNYLKKIFFKIIVSKIILYIYISNFKKKIICLFIKPQILIEKKYKNQNILLIGLFEKGILRSDIINLFQTAKKLNLFVVAINTLRLKNVKEYSHLIDVYIERYNFGRDFGSYKFGFEYLFRKSYTHTCPRLLMCNDSVFYSKKNLISFLQNHFSPSSEEVLGTTENHEIEHHLGSFCISMNQNILRHKKFIRFWKNYTNSEFRPKVIKEGEMKLTQVLKKCVSNPLQIRTIFDVTHLLNYIKQDSNFFKNLPDLYRSSEDVEWKRSSLKKVYERFLYKYHFTNTIPQDQTTFINNFYTISRNLNDIPKNLNLDLKEINQKVLEEAKIDLIDCFSSGSQIHQNGLLLYYMGLPIIKLDLLYRGVFSNQDVLQLLKLITEDEKETLSRLLFSKPFGSNVFVKMKRIAFMHGLI